MAVNPKIKVALECPYFVVGTFILFLVCTVCLLVTMVVLVVVAYVFSSNAKEAISLRLLEQDILDDTMKREIINTFQLRVECCCYNNFSDWTNNSMTIALPCTTTNSSTISTPDCLDALHTFLHFRMRIVLVILGVLAIIEVVSIVLSVIVLKDLASGITTAETSATDSEGPGDSPPRTYNPLGQNSLPSVDNSNRAGELYVRRPRLQPVILNYQSPHESFLRQPPQLRFDRRIVLPSIRNKNPYAIHPG